MPTSKRPEMVIPPHRLAMILQLWERRATGLGEVTTDIETLRTLIAQSRYAWELESEYVVEATDAD